MHPRSNKRYNPSRNTLIELVLIISVTIVVPTLDYLDIPVNYAVNAVR